MACKLPHTVEELQRFIKNETENRDVDRQNAIVEVIKKLEVAKQQKERLRERYGECTDISADRKYVIDKFLYDEYRKEAVVIESLWVCVNQIQAEISNKIRWSFEENVESGKVEQQRHQQQQQQGASSSSAPRFVVQQQQLPHLDHFRLNFEENVPANDGGWNSEDERELSRLEAQLEQENFARYSAYEDGYDSNNSQTWDHPDYN